MTSDAEQIRQWYKLIRQNSTCVCGKRDGLPAEYGRVEFHHMNAGAKCDTLSNMAIKPLIPCLTYTVAPVSFALELMKVVPLAPERHKELHRADDKGDWPLLRHRFDFDHDPFYRAEVKAFRTMAMDLAPPAMLAKVQDGMFDLMETGHITFGQNGYALV